MSDAVKWNEGLIAGEIARQTLAKKCVVLVDRCNWTGNECDVLGVTTCLRIVDVEVKISRADLKADAGKDKWWHRRWGQYNPVTRAYDQPPHTRREWPPRVWKHYYAMPADIWRDDLVACLPSPRSGILLLSKKPGECIRVTCHRRATPCRDAARLTPAQVMDIARLANLRMWDAYRDADMARRDARHWYQQTKGMP